MPLKKSQGNMYPWVTHTHSHLGGECPHKCSYCYVDNPRFGRHPRYTGPLRLIENEFKIKYGSGKVIFEENCNDLFAKLMPQEFINRVVHHCLKWPDNEYVWQTKNPARYLTMDALMPGNSIFGCTIETNRDIPPEISLAPHPTERFEAMKALQAHKFITVEPIMDFDVLKFAAWINDVKPDFVNIGADSKGHGLPEPPIEKVMELIRWLTDLGIEVREKHNLERLRAEKTTK
ncbi:MAG: hypothetical protein A4E60_00161 [Syntrophorhabdus sp. PtaB.Bin047]|nr:MAG: hypothetical protein A4E60_00161 [Syntrophorhabdus sp. PtaB.Bin047]